MRRDGHVSFINEAAAQLFRVDPKKTVETKVGDLAWCDDPKTHEGLLLAIQRQEAAVFQGRVHVHGQDNVPVDLTITPVPEDVEDLVDAACVIHVQDLSPIDAERARWNRMFYNTPGVAIQSYDTQGKVLSWNPAAEQVFGYSREEALGKPLDELILSPGEFREFKVMIREILRSGCTRGPVEFACRHRDGSQLFVLSTIFPVPALAQYPAIPEPGSDRPALLCMDMDVTDRKQKSSLASFARAICRSLDIRENLHHALPKIVPRFADIFAVFALEQDALRLLHSVQIKAPERQLLEALETTFQIPDSMRHGKPLFCLDIPSVGADHLPVDESTQSVLRRLATGSLAILPLNLHGKTLGIALMGTNSSGRRFRRQDLKFCKEIARETTFAMENALLFAKARQSIQIRDDFIAIASHELRTPVTALRMNMELIREFARKASPMNEEELRRLSKVSELSIVQITRLTRLISDILDVSQIESGKLTLRFEESDLTEHASATVERILQGFPYFRNKVLMDFPRPVVGCWDIDRIEQVIENLLTNALKYGKDRPISLKITGDGVNATIVVRDEGIGIPLEQQRVIFSRFGRAVTPGSYSGIGLGLFIVQQIVDAHRGTVSVQSTSGNGSVFTVILPLNTQPAAQKRTA